MIVTLSDYIMEQTVSPASCEDIAMEQGLAEMQVYTALANAYAKQIMMLEYAAEYTMEADDETATTTATEEKKTSKFKEFWRTIWEGIKKAIFWLRDRFVDFGKWIKGKFNKKSIEKAEQIAENGSDEEVAAIVDSIYDAGELKTSDETASATVAVQPAKKLSAFELLTAYEVDDIANIINDIASLAEKLRTNTKSIFTANRNNSKGFIKGALSSNINALGEELSKLEVRKSNAGWVSVSTKDKRGMLKKMTQFVKWMTSEGFNKLDEIDKKLNDIVKDEDTNMDFSNTPSENVTEITKTLSNLQKTIFNVSHGLGELSLQTRQLATVIQKEVAQYESGVYKERHGGKSKAVADYEEKQSHSNESNYGHKED